jgi:DNA-binding NarL/FixJ family response regulator
LTYARISGRIVLEALIVEDNSLFRQVMRDILNSRFPSLTVLEARDGAEALDTFEADRPGIVFMDIKLPGGLDGLELTRRMRKMDPNLTVVVVTNHDSAEYETAAINSGANFFLSKNASLSDEIAAIMPEEV